MGLREKKAGNLKQPQQSKSVGRGVFSSLEPPGKELLLLDALGFGTFQKIIFVLHLDSKFRAKKAVLSLWEGKGLMPRILLSSKISILSPNQHLPEHHDDTVGTHASEWALF